MERFSDDPSRFEPGATLHHEDGRILTVSSARGHRDRFLVSFEGVVDRTGAEGLRGTIYVEGAELRELTDGEYWPDDLIGCVLVSPDDRELGRVADVTSNPAHDLLVLEDGSMVPMVGEIVTGIDLEARRISVDPPEGLIG